MFSSSMTLKMMKQNQRHFGFLIALILTLVSFSPIEALAQNKIAVSVNKEGVVTSYQITQRSRFLRLTGFKGDSVAEARKQLVREEIQLQEAKRVDLKIRPSAVDDAYDRFAKGNGATPEQFSKALRSRGVNPATLKKLIKARITWQQYVIARARVPEITDAPDAPKKKTDVTSILFNKNTDGENRRTKEYTIERFIFIVKNGANEKQAQQRLREVEAFRRSHSTCEAATQNALKLASSGVISKSLGRFTEATLPQTIKPDILEAGDALFTKPKRRSTGIELMAICKTREIVDNSIIEPINIEADKLNNKELEGKSKKWMENLEAKAVIRNH